MGGVICVIARIRFEVDRNRAIGGQAKAENDLLKIWSVILAVPAKKLHTRGCLSRHLSAGLDTGRIIV